MICKNCETQVTFKKQSLVWVASCECTAVEHPWMEKATELHINAVYQKTHNNPAVSASNLEPDISDAAEG